MVTVFRKREKMTEKITTLLIRIEKIHRAYISPKATTEIKDRLLNGTTGLMDELTKLGFTRDFLVTLIMWGDEFVGDPENTKDFAVSDELCEATRQVFSGEWLLMKVAEFTGRESYCGSSFWSMKSGYDNLQTRRFLARLVSEGKVLQYGEGRDLWAATLAVQRKYGFVKEEAQKD